MVAGAVLIGRPIGPGMIRPFTIKDFRDLESKCNLALIARCPLEVVHPECLEYLKRSPYPGLVYQEGILVNIYESKASTKEEFEQKVGERIVAAAKMAEKLYCESNGEAFKNSSDLCHEKVVRVSLGSSGFDLDWKPIMQVLAVYDENNAAHHYAEVATPLLGKTRGARIRIYSENQKRLFSQSSGAILDEILRAKGEEIRKRAEANKK